MLGVTRSITDIGSSISFERPWFLLLLLLLPLIWYLSFRSLAGLGKWRRLFALVLRSAVLTVLALALAKAQWLETNDGVCVIYVLDQSESIPQEKRDLMIRYAVKSVEKHRVREKDQAGVVIFGGDAKIESPPHDGPLPNIDRLESDFDLQTQSTSLEAAIKLAKASFPEGVAQRVVLISDGNENLGDVRTIAQAMADEGTGFDVVPVELLAESEVSVDKVVVPVDVRKGQEFEARIVLTNDAKPSEINPTGEVKGTLRIMQRNMHRTQLLDEVDGLVLKPGKNVIPFEHKIDESSVYNIDAIFTPDDPTQDLIEKNNTASAFTHVRGKGRVLLIQDGNFPGEFSHLIESLQQGNLEVDLMNSTELFTTAAELMQYDTIVLANVPRATGETVESTESFSDAQVRMMVRNCEELGCGIVMIGGDRSFGAGGWSNSDLEKAMPVDFQIKNEKISAVGALALMMHACEMPDGNYWQSVVAKNAIEVLGPLDYCGVIEWSNQGGPKWLWKFKDPNDGQTKGVAPVFNNRKKMMAMVNRMAMGDMPDFNQPMQLMLKGLLNSKASVKHAIIISDGDPTPPTAALLQKFIDNKIKISTCTIGSHRQQNPMADIAKKTGGHHYPIRNPTALPKIYQREARRVAKPVIKENKGGMAAIAQSVASSHEITQGIKAESLPAYYGYVMTTLKDNPLVEQILVSNDPPDHPQNSTLLASWQYGVGRTVTFSSDAGHQWLGDWYSSEYYDKLFTQMIRYSMRPISKNGNFSVNTEIRDNVARVVVTALDDDDEFLDFLDMSARGFDPELNGFDLSFSQVAPGRYVAEFDTDKAGNYLFSVFPDEGYQRLTAGINVPYSSEYSDREANMALLESLCSLTPEGGEAGELIPESLLGGINDMLGVDTFRQTLPKAFSINAMWPYLMLLAGWVFFFDVLVRRVALHFGWIKTAWNKFLSIFGRAEEEAAPNPMSRLQRRKAEIDRKFEQRRASTRFEPDPDTEMNKGSGQDQLDSILDSEHRKEIQAPPAARADANVENEEQSTYTSRLLDAKRRAQKDRDNK